MTRKEQILQEADNYIKGKSLVQSTMGLCKSAFIEGAKWADRHPLIDIENNWHTPDEEPQGKNWCILARDGIGLLWTATRAEENIITSSDWNRFVLKHDLIEWTYYKYPELVVKQ